MESKRLAAQKQSDLENPKADRFEENLSSEVPGSNVEYGEQIDSNASSVITDEVLTHRIRTLIDEKPRPSTLHTISINPLVVVVVGGLIGVGLTQYYTSLQKDLEYNRTIQQQELARQRSFSDELSKIRIQKFGDVWERIDENEIDIDSLLDDGLSEGPKTDSDTNEKKGEKIRSLIHEDLAIISKNRFWLGEETYDKARQYLNINIQYALNKLLVRPGTDLSEVINKRKQAKQDILQARSMFLEGAPGK